MNSLLEWAIYGYNWEVKYKEYKINYFQIFAKLGPFLQMIHDLKNNFSILENFHKMFFCNENYKIMDFTLIQEASPPKSI